VDPETGRIDYDAVHRLTEQCRPKMIVAGASAYPRILDFATFAQIAEEIDAYLMVDMAHIAGLVATGLHPSPIPHAHVVTSTTHKTLRGPRGGLILSRSNFGDKLRSEVFPGIQGGPLMHVIAAKAVAFKEAMRPQFKTYQQQVLDNAQTLAECLLGAGLNLVSGGTDNHLMLVDLDSWNITGKKAETALGKAGITVNKNAVPFDKRGPFITSGIRIGTPFVTSRGLDSDNMTQVAAMIVDVLKHMDDTGVLARTKAKVAEMCQAHPLYAQDGRN
jgi:glycine hydroxymethyltransferase